MSDKIEDSDTNIQALMHTIDTLQHQKSKLTQQNHEMNRNLENLTGQIEASRMLKQSLHEDIESIHFVSSRVDDLENEVSRLQGDLILSKTRLQEANADLDVSKNALEELRRSDFKMSRKLGIVKKEKMFLLEKIRNDSEGVRESNCRIRELEKKIKALESRDSVYKSVKVRVVDEMRLVIEERDGEICDLENAVEELRDMMERSYKERDELAIGKSELEVLLKKSERRKKEMESRMGLLHVELEGSDKMIGRLKKDKALDGIGGNYGLESCVDDQGEDGVLGLNLDWSAVVASSCSIALVAVVYLRYT
ncbi:hypothetical protein POM88_016946 [Heracleum sosnowskyi]|uniref:Uncharacterized protein n=1 Tax=Heracleum sosnowskyi TaxID=360622 RepID=A0AAD8IPX6_9APIA|nr:hypothetical protein POM88_016946 [Heracleum sosnowskyi]